MTDEESKITWPIALMPWVEPEYYQKMVSVTALSEAGKQRLWGFLKHQEPLLADLLRSDLAKESSLRVYLPNLPGNLIEWFSAGPYQTQDCELK